MPQITAVMSIKYPASVAKACSSFDDIRSFNNEVGETRDYTTAEWQEIVAPLMEIMENIDMTLDSLIKENQKFGGGYLESDDDENEVMTTNCSATSNEQWNGDGDGADESIHHQWYQQMHGTVKLRRITETLSNAMITASIMGRCIRLEHTITSSFGRIRRMNVHQLSQLDNL